MQRAGLLGAIAHWLQNCSQARQVEHVYAPYPPFEQRAAARDLLVEVPGAIALQTLERPQPSEGET